MDSYWIEKEINTVDKRPQDKFIFLEEDKIEFVKRNRNGFVSEFNLNTAQKKAISDKFYGSKQLISQLMEITVDGEEDFQTGIKCFAIQDENYHKTIL